jgi:hypothetical protein
MIEFLLILILIAVLFGAEAVIGLIRFLVSAALTFFAVGAAAVVAILIYSGVIHG